MARSPDDEAKNVLAAVRKHAEDWRTGTAVVLGLITAALALTGAKDSARLFEHLDVQVPLALVLAAQPPLGLAVFALPPSRRRPPWLDDNLKERVRPWSPLASVISDELELRRRLQKAQQLLWIGIGLFVVFVVLQL